MINHLNNYHNSKFLFNKHKFNNHQYSNKFQTFKIYTIFHYNSKHQMWLLKVSHQLLFNRIIHINNIHNSIKLSSSLHNININNLDFNNNNNFLYKNNLDIIPLINSHIQFNQIFINHLKLILHHIMLIHHVIFLIIILSFRVEC